MNFIKQNWDVLESEKDVLIQDAPYGLLLVRDRTRIIIKTPYAEYVENSVPKIEKTSSQCYDAETGEKYFYVEGQMCRPIYIKLHIIAVNR